MYSYRKKCSHWPDRLTTSLTNGKHSDLLLGASFLFKRPFVKTSLTLILRHHYHVFLKQVILIKLRQVRTFQANKCITNKYISVCLHPK